MRAAARAAAGQGVLIIGDTIIAKPHDQESNLDLEENTLRAVWLWGVEFPVIAIFGGAFSL